MLLAARQPGPALASFETTLKKEPNRYRALAGAAEAARQGGNSAAVRKYSRALLDLAARADGAARPEIAAARDGVK